jgi:nucleotide-binding universal stress UspA family protein
LVAGWLAYAAGLGHVMARRGHRRLTWTVIGLVTGPLALVAAFAAVTRGEGVEQQTVLIGRLGSGDVAVVAGIDGSVEAQRAVETAVQWLGPRLSRVQLVGILDFDAGLGDGLEQRHLQDAVRNAGAAVTARPGARRGPRLRPSGVLCTGPVAKVLLAVAENDCDLLVVGRPGPDDQSGVREIIGRAPVPVLVGR